MRKPLSVKILMYLLNLVSNAKILDKILRERRSLDLVLCYHDVGNSNWEFAVKKNNFEKQIKFLVENYNVVPLKEMLKTKNHGERFKVAITFDDGLLGVYKNAYPILEKYNLAATVFLIGDKFVGHKSLNRYMGVKEIKRLIDNGWEIGYHTYSHKDLVKLSDAALLEEIKGKNILEKKLKARLAYFAYPHGKYNNKILSAVSKMNFSFAFTTNGRTLNNPMINRFALGRITISNFLGQKEFESLLTPTGIIINLIFTKIWSLKDFIFDASRLKLKLIKRDIFLLYKYPISYFYSFFESSSEKVYIENYSPKSTLVGEKIVRDIEKRFPNYKVHFHGSSALRIPGKNDIDIIIECNKNDFEKVLPQFKKFLGKPRKIGNKFIEWHFRREKYKVELLLIDPKSRMFKELITVYLVLRSDKKLLKEYEQIKLNSSGLSPREYQKNRLEFYNKLMSVKLS